MSTAAGLYDSSIAGMPLTGGVATQGVSDAPQAGNDSKAATPKAARIHGRDIIGHPVFENVFTELIRRRPLSESNCSESGEDHPSTVRASGC